MNNNLFYTCSLIECIARKTKNTKKDIINFLGEKNVEKILNLADIYHAENIDKVVEEFKKTCNITSGNYDVTKNKGFNIPTYWEIGKVYKNLIIMVNNNPQEYTKTLIQVLSSWIILKIDNYNSNMYYENPSYIYECYKENKIL